MINSSSVAVVIGATARALAKLDVVVELEVVLILDVLNVVGVAGVVIVGGSLVNALCHFFDPFQHKSHLCDKNDGSYQQNRYSEYQF
jgi:hypothetical protein